MTNIGFIGLGRMGYCIASNLNKEFKTYVWNRTIEKALKHSKEFGTIFIEELNLIPKKCNYIFFCLPTHNEVKQIIDKIKNLLNDSHILIDCTSSDFNVQKQISNELIKKIYIILMLL